MAEGQESGSSISKRMITLQEGDEVLVNFPNGYKYFGVIVDIESEVEGCLVRYGDRTEQWASIRNVKKLGLGIRPEPETETVAKVTDGPTHKKSKTSMPKPLKAKVKPPRPVPKQPDLLLVPDYVLKAREALPYRLESLTWDDNHLRNDEESYCYCGGEGFWYKRMYQCNQCLQWFHQSCSGKFLDFEMLYGDRFFNFVCAICSPTGNASIRRLDMKISDAIHLAVLNLTLKNVKKFHHLSNDILPFLQRMKKSFLGPYRTLNLEKFKASNVKEILEAHTEKFVSATLDHQGSDYWGINFLTPTSTPIIGNLTKPEQTTTSPFYLSKGPSLRQLSKTGSYDWLIESNKEWLTMSQEKYEHLRTLDELIPNPPGFLSTTFNPFRVSSKALRLQAINRKQQTKLDPSLQSRYIKGIRTTSNGKREYLVQYS